MRVFSGTVRRAVGKLPWWLVCAVIALGAAAGACREEALKRTEHSEAGAPGGLTRSQAAIVLATVGERKITLGEFAATLERMDQFDRLRYQTPERRRELLESMVTVELLAREARRRGLDKDPEMKVALRQILRDSILSDIRQGVKPPAAIPAGEVRAYYEAHKDEFREPERRRVSVLVVASEAKAKELLAQANETNNAKWGALVAEHSEAYKDKPHKGPVETAGDLGLVGPPGESRGANPRVLPVVRAAVFEISKVGGVLDRPIRDSRGKWNIVRLASRTEAHSRSFAEAERTIRITMVQREIASREKALEAELRKQFPVTIDDSALSEVKLPSGAVDAGSSPPKRHEH